MKDSTGSPTYRAGGHDTQPVISFAWEARDLRVGYECGSCHTRYDADHHAEEMDDEKLRCVECGQVGVFVVRRNDLYDRVSRYESIVSRGFTQVPRALTDHAAAIGLKPGEAWLVVQLDSLRFESADAIELTMEAIGKRLGMSAPTAERWLRDLKKRGLIAWLSGKRSHEPNVYDLKPLWARLDRHLRGADQADDLKPMSPSELMDSSVAGQFRELSPSGLMDISRDEVELFSTSHDRVFAAAGEVAHAPGQPPTEPVAIAEATSGLEAAPQPDNDSTEERLYTRCVICGTETRPKLSPTCSLEHMTEWRRRLRGDCDSVKLTAA